MCKAGLGGVRKGWVLGLGSGSCAALGLVGWVGEVSRRRVQLPSLCSEGASEEEMVFSL